MGEDSGEGGPIAGQKRSHREAIWRLSLEPPHLNLLPPGEKRLLRLTRQEGGRNMSDGHSFGSAQDRRRGFASLHTPYFISLSGNRQGRFSVVQNIPPTHVGRRRISYRPRTVRIRLSRLAVMRRESRYAQAHPCMPPVARSRVSCTSSSWSSGRSGCLSPRRSATNAARLAT